MNLADVKTVKDLLQRHGFTFSKGLGQNFLINPSVCPRMAELCTGPGKGVLEIGPGFGVLTRELAARAEKTVAVELDRRLEPVLAETLKEFSNVHIIFGDILKLDLQELFAREFGGMPVSVCANLPYYITSPVIMGLLESRVPADSIIVMVQKEAAQRICAPVGSRESGAVTVAVHYYSRPELLFSVSRGSFFPAPNVDSAVIRLNVRKEPPVTAADETHFFRVVRAAFAMRRKTVHNALAAGLNLPKDAVGDALSASGIPLSQRAERLSLQDFARLSDALQQN